MTEYIYEKWYRPATEPIEIPEGTIVLSGEVEYKKFGGNEVPYLALSVLARYGGG